MTQQSKRWCATLNNPTSAHIEALTTKESVASLVSYLIVGKEVAPTSGTPHLQIYLELKKKKTLGGLKKILGLPTIHLEVAHGTADQNIQYCSKEQVIFTMGTPMKQGKRNDLETVKKAIDEGKSLEELWEQNFSMMCRYRNGIGHYYTMVRSKKLREDPPDCFIYHGPTGTGKTRTAYSLDPDSFWVYPGKGWFDGYCGQRVAIFDEFDGSDLDFGLFKRITDRYPMNVPVKGGFTPWYPEIIAFTSNVDPKYWWKDQSLPNGWWDQLVRRIPLDNIELME